MGGEGGRGPSRHRVTDVDMVPVCADCLRVVYRDADGRWRHDDAYLEPEDDG